MSMDAQLRDKDRELGRRCREAAAAAGEAVEWLAAHRPGAGNANAASPRGDIEGKRR